MGYGNLSARLASWLTGVAHARAPAIRWGVLALLAGVWIWAGYVGWRHQAEPDDALYRTIGALTYQDSYGDTKDPMLRLARFVGMFVPIVGLLFAFSGQLGQSLAQLFHTMSGGHIVIAGDSAAALRLAQDCARHRDVVAFIAADLPDETIRALRKRGVICITGDPASVDALRFARAARAAHVVAFCDDDTVNLRIEAAVRQLVAQARHSSKVHVAMRSPLLLQEARELRMQIQRDHDRAKIKPPPVETSPFSLDELAARKLISEHGHFMLLVGERKTHAHPHLVIFGYDDTAEAVAVRALMGLWSARFGAPHVTVVTPDPTAAEAQFEARYPEARRHDLWKADIAFLAFDWTHRSASENFLREIEARRGPANGVVISTGQDGENIALALGVLRACNAGLAEDEAQAFWAVPIYMRETSESEFSRQFAGGDRTPNLDDAFIEAFGAYERVATRAMIIEGDMDQGAAMAHQIYNAGQESRAAMGGRELEAMRRSWDDVSETYRHASRGVADHAMIKLWDAGWAPAPEGVKGEMQPEMSEAETARLAELEHTRWMAERLMSGWRPGDKRDNRLRVHDKIAPWSEMTADDKAKDMDQVRNAVTLARAMHRRGFVRRNAAPM
jgi:Trk K+ transport system NAD-binding subunit